MNGSKENDSVFMTCTTVLVSKNFLDHDQNFERNQIATVAVNCILLLSTIALNGVSVITIRKSSQLRGKVCYFVILLQSIVDLGVAFVGIPLYLYYLLSPFGNVVNCVATTLAFRISYAPFGLSTATLSAMALERYIGVLHPYQYKSKVTKKRILVYVCGHGFLLLFVIAYSYRNRTLMRVYARASVAALFFFTGFVYVRIYRVIRKLIRSEKRVVGDDDGVQVNKQIKREVRRARSCFLVILCFFIFLLPYSLTPVLFNPSSVEFRVYFNWTYTLAILNSSVNSVIFFWTKTLLRKEAVRILRSLHSTFFDKYP